MSDRSSVEKESDDIQRFAEENSEPQLRCPQTRLSDLFLNKPFWNWSIEAHKHIDIRTQGNCCFNHIIGLPAKDGSEKPLFDYENFCMTLSWNATFTTHSGTVLNTNICGSRSQLG